MLILVFLPSKYKSYFVFIRKQFRIIRRKNAGVNGLHLSSPAEVMSLVVVLVGQEPQLVVRKEVSMNGS